MQFCPDCPLPDLVKTLPHVAFRVDDLETAVQGQDVLIPPNSPSPGIRVAFIVENGAPVEFLEDQTRASEAPVEAYIIKEWSAGAAAYLTVVVRSTVAEFIQLEAAHDLAHLRQKRAILHQGGNSWSEIGRLHYKLGRSPKPRTG